MNRRLAVYLTALTLGALLTGCAQHQRFGNDPAVHYELYNGTDPVMLPAKYGGTLISANEGDPKTFNYWVTQDLYSGTVTGILYDALEQRNPYTLKFEPRLASLPKISADGRTYTFTLRPNLKWSDGFPLTADDVIFTLDVIFDPNIQTLMREPMEVAVRQPGGKSKLEPFQYKKLDDRTVQFTLPERWAPALEMFSFNIAPKHALEKIYRSGQFNSAWGIDTPPSQIISAGPYVMTQYVAGQRVVYRRNPYFWKYVDNQQMPYLDKYTYLITPDQNASQLNFRDGGSDTMLVSTHSYPSFARYARRDNYTLVNAGLDWGTAFIAFNENPDSTMKRSPTLLKLFQDKRFRQACSYAIDRQTICTNISLGLARPLYGPVTPADLNFFDRNAPSFPYDPSKAKMLLAEAGCTPGANGMLQYEGQSVKFNVLSSVESSNGMAAATIIENSWRSVGIDATVVGVTFDNLDTKVTAPPYDWQAVLMGFGGGPEPNDIADLWRTSSVSHLWHPGEKQPATEWEARINADFDKGAEVLDINERKKYYDDWQEVAGDEQPLLFVYDADMFFTMRNHFGNIQPASSAGQSSGLTWNVEEMYDTHAARFRAF